MSNMNFVWAVEDLAHDATNKLLSVHWSCTASKDGKSAFYGGESSLPFDEAASGSVKFSDLTEDSVIQMLFGALGKQVEEIQADRSLRVENQINTNTVTGVPWHAAATV
jgi:hypothetical protein